MVSQNVFAVLAMLIKTINLKVRLGIGSQKRTGKLLVKSVVNMECLLIMVKMIVLLNMYAVLRVIVLDVCQGLMIFLLILVLHVLLLVDLWITMGRLHVSLL